MIPDFQSIMRPLLDVLSDGNERDTVSLRDALAERFDVSLEERAQLLPSGTARLYDNRVAWAYVHLHRAGAIDRLRRGVYRITPRGVSLLGQQPERIDLKVLSQFPEFLEFRRATKGKKRQAEPSEEAATLDDGRSPTERLAGAHAEHQAEVTSALMDRIRTCHPTFFEQLVLKVLVAMGYGGSEEEASEHLGHSGDGGVDGVINEDSLGLDRVYVQAKRWAENPVGRPDVQAFVGALEGRGATKGVFITASHFTSDATEYAERLTRRVVLIDGQRLAELMMRFGVGVTTRETFPLQEVDEDFFFSELG